MLSSILHCPDSRAASQESCVFREVRDGERDRTSPGTSNFEGSSSRPGENDEEGREWRCQRRSERRMIKKKGRKNIY